MVSEDSVEVGAEGEVHPRPGDESGGGGPQRSPQPRRVGPTGPGIWGGGGQQSPEQGHPGGL